MAKKKVVMILSGGELAGMAKAETLYVIEDIRDKKVYLDNRGFLRVFERILAENITLEEAQKKYPGIIDCRG